MCHLLLALPVIALPLLWLWAPELAVPTYAAVTLVSLAFYAYALKAMRMRRLNGAEGMLGDKGRIVQASGRQATLFFHGELWRADVEGEPLALGDEASIVAVDGLRLRVRKRPNARQP